MSEAIITENICHDMLIQSEEKLPRNIQTSSFGLIRKWDKTSTHYYSMSKGRQDMPREEL